ncbi:Rha family transcriptional regulator [Methylorubrum extorquens]|uniref:Rha family transcriptional regulator n=1 Tax=Methylorubrum extorquens TaxID=408 RepID=A0AAX3WDK1_METEX|nr:Rha family transcriptional regulator [Methylorubrum extorquens]WHQ68871.1 Rha family transcriptional regulator [Methylorubrum extorquens]
MTSLEIADLTAKEHRNVMRDARVMLTELHAEGGLLRFEHSYRAGNGKMEPCFALPYDETMVLVTGYSIPLRAAVVRRWRELEQAQAPRIPTHVEALRLSADAIERAEQEALLLAARSRELLKQIVCEHVAGHRDLVEIRCC